MASTAAMHMLLKPPTFNGKNASFLQWKLRFMMYLGTAGCKAALDQDIEKDLPTPEADGEAGSDRGCQSPEGIPEQHSSHASKEKSMETFGAVVNADLG
jgi:hypothetical protein